MPAFLFIWCVFFNVVNVKFFSFLSPWWESKTTFKRERERESCEWEHVIVTTYNYKVVEEAYGLNSEQKLVVYYNVVQLQIICIYYFLKIKLKMIFGSCYKFFYLYTEHDN